MGTSVRYQDPQQIWTDISKEQWELLWSGGETAFRKYGESLWTEGHKTVNLFPATLVPHIMCITGPGIQKHTTKIPSSKGLPQSARKTIEQYLKVADWASLLVNKEPQENDQSWTSSTEIVAWQESRHTEPTPSKDIGRLIVVV
jgi:hypothetical protein